MKLIFAILISLVIPSFASTASAYQKADAVINYVGGRWEIENSMATIGVPDQAYVMAADKAVAKTIGKLDKVNVIRYTCSLEFDPDLTVPSGPFKYVSIFNLKMCEPAP